MSCIDRVKEKFPNLDGREAKRLAKQFDNVAEMYSENASLFREKSKKIVDEFTERQSVIYKNKANHAQKKHKILNHIFQEGFLNDPIEGFLSLFEGSNRKTSGKYLNIDNIRSQTEGLLTNKLETALSQAGVQKYFFDEKNNAEIARALDSLKKSYATSNNPAERSAWILAQTNAHIFNKLTRAGSSIKAQKRYMFMQSHNTDLILSDPLKWANDIAPLLDWDRSFGTGEVTKIEDAVDRLVSMAKTIEETGYGSVGLFGGKRELHFKDNEKFIQYNETYGYRSLAEGVKATIRSASRQISVLEVLGPNYWDMVREIKDTIVEVQKGRPNVSEDRVKLIDNAMDLAMGVGDRNGYSSRKLHSNYAKYSDYARTVEAMAKLGKSGFSAALDMGTIVLSSNMFSGRPLPIAATDTLLAMIKSAAPGQRKEIQEMTNLALDSISREFFELVGSPTRSNGLKRLLNTGLSFEMTLNLTNTITNHMRKTASNLAISNLSKAVSADKPNNYQQQTLNATGLSPKDIDNLRAMMKEQGTKEVGTRLVRRSELLDIRERELLEMKLGSFFNQASLAGSPRKGAKESRAMLGYLKKDHPWRVTLENVFMFKGALLRIHNLVVERARTASPSGKLKNVNAYASLGTSLFLLGSLQYAKDRIQDFIVNGEEPDPEKFVPQYAQSLTSSGAMGIYITSLFEIAGAYSTGQSGARIPSPLAEDFSRGVRISSDFLTGEDSDKQWKKIKRLLYRMTPYNNIIWIDNEIRRNMMPIEAIDED